MARQSLEAWITEALTDDEKQKCTALSLIHYAGQIEKEIWTVRFGAKEWTAKTLAEVFKRKSDSFAQDLPGVQTFCMLAFYEGDEKPQARHPMTVQGEAELSGLATEGPTGSGLVQQAMRHSEAIIQLAFRQNIACADAQTALITQLSTMLQKSLVENHDALDIIRTVIMEKASNDHEMRMKELKAKQGAEERKKLLQMVPALTNTVFGREVFPLQTADTALMETMAQSVDERAIEALAATMPPELFAMIANRFMGVLKAKRVAQEDAEHALANKNPEDDAAGD